MFFEKHYRTILIAIWIAQSAALLVVTWDMILQWKMGDPDDQLRLVQVRDWLAGQSWWDIDQYRMNPPYGGPMHWSRLVDIPIAALILLLTPLLGQPSAEHLTVVAVPLLTLGVVVYLLASITRALFGAKAALVAAASIILMLPVTIQLVPMRIDHHGWQLVAFLIGVKFLLDSTTPVKSAIIIGMAMAIWMEISIEGLPFAVLFMGLLAIRWFTPDERRSTQFAWGMISLATTSAVLFFSTERLQLAGNYCDELSPFHLAALATSAVIVVAGTVATPKSAARWSLAWKVSTGGLAAAAALAVVMKTAPQCVGDTFSGLDPLVRQYWYDRVLEGLPLWQQPFAFVAQEIAGLLFGVVALILLFKIKSGLSLQERITIALLFLGCAAVGMQVSRAAVYALCLSMMLLTPAIIILFARAEKIEGMWKRNGMRLLACALFMPGVVGANAAVLADNFEKPATVSKQVREDKLMGLARQCQAKQFIAPLNRLPASQLMAGLDTSPALLQFTRHNVVATGHHRNQLAMRDVILAFTGSPETAQQIYVKRGIEYLISCDGSFELLMYRNNAPKGLWARLSRGERFAWLERQPDIGPYHIWRVNIDKSGPPAQTLTDSPQLVP